MAQFATFMLAFLICVLSCQSFTVDLIRRDSSKSPFYNSSITQFGRLGDAIRRSINRAHGINLATMAAAGESSSSDLVPSQKSQIVASGGEYLLDILVGTPPVKIFAVADTGSDLTWTQCAPCTSCYKQTAPLFDPRKSSSYRALRCHSSACSAFDFTSCGQAGCQYSMHYGDQSHTIGTLSVDTIQLGTAGGRPVSLQSTVFGCGFDNAGTFDESASGIVGLGGGDSSQIIQSKSQIGGRFSYCLVPLDATDKASKLNFGPDAAVTGTGTVATPLVSKSPSTFYWLTLESFSVGNKKVAYNPRTQQEVEEGNIIIDSGTTLTLLPEDLYSGLETEVKSQIDLEPVEPQGSLNLCYSAQTHFDVPVITAHFSGADVKLSALNTFVKVSEDVVCFPFVSNAENAIWGNLAQMNFLVGYDLNQRTVSFKPADCTTL